MPKFLVDFVFLDIVIRQKLKPVGGGGGTLSTDGNDSSTMVFRGKA
jgi:hypothetical protein